VHLANLIAIASTTKMKHLAAYLLLTLGGNTSPSASDVKEVLESVGIEADSERLDKLLSELEGKDINEVRAEPLSHEDANYITNNLTFTADL
jgi:ribosomal protein L12E/L44/L45/RPP1/RPP2